MLIKSWDNEWELLSYSDLVGAKIVKIEDDESLFKIELDNGWTVQAEYGYNMRVWQKEEE
jgi:hypothetical protein